MVQGHEELVLSLRTECLRVVVTGWQCNGCCYMEVVKVTKMGRNGAVRGISIVQNSPKDSRRHLGAYLAATQEDHTSFRPIHLQGFVAFQGYTEKNLTLNHSTTVEAMLHSQGGHTHHLAAEERHRSSPHRDDDGYLRTN